MVLFLRIIQRLVVERYPFSELVWNLESFKFQTHLLLITQQMREEELYILITTTLASRTPPSSIIVLRMEMTKRATLSELDIRTVVLQTQYFYQT